MAPRLIRRFTEVLALLDRGKFEQACNDALNEALQSLEDLPKGQGTAEININVKIAFDSGRVDIQPAIKSKLPVAQAFGRTPMWAHDGGLSTQHPDQFDMLREVDQSETSEAEAG